MKRIKSQRKATEGELREMGHVTDMGNGNTLRHAVDVTVTEYEDEWEDPLDRFAVSKPDALRVKLRGKPRKEKRR